MAEPEVQSRAEEVARLLLTIHRSLRRYSKQVSAELGVSGRQLSVLRRLHEAGPLSVGQISSYVYLADSTTSELLDGLQALGLVERTRSSEDNRVAVVTLTAAGDALVARAPLAGIALLRQRLRAEPGAVVDDLARALERLGRLMEIDAR